MRAAVVLAAVIVLAAAAPDPHGKPPDSATPRQVPADGTVIKPVGPVDPGIQAKAPSPSRFPMPVIRPAPVQAPPR